MIAFFIVCWTLTGLAIVLAGIFMAARMWWEKQAHLYYVDYEAAKRREQHEPWYVRFAKWTFRDKDDR